MKVTIIMLAYARFKRIEELMEKWLAEPEVDELILLDNSGKFQSNVPSLLVNFSNNLGCQARYPMAMLAKNEIVLFADDDVLIEPGLVSEYSKYWRPNRCLSLMGRIFDAEDYYDTTGVRSENIDKLTPVDLCQPGFMMVERKYCPVPTTECPYTGFDGLWWSHYVGDKINRFVIPTSKYSFIPGYLEADPLYKREKTQRLVRKYYKEWGYSSGK